MSNEIITKHLNGVIKVANVTYTHKDEILVGLYLQSLYLLMNN